MVVNFSLLSQTSYICHEVKLSSSNVFSGIAVRRYALAFYELSKENNELEKAETEVNAIKNLIKSHSEFRNMIASPTIDKIDQINALKQLSEKFSFTKTFKNFLEFIASKRRLFFLNEILNNFLNLTSLKRGEVKVKLISSKELNSEEIEKIKKDLENDYGSKLNINYIYDPKLLGGLVVQIGSIMIDTSIKSKLQKYKQIMSRN